MLVQLSPIPGTQSAWESFGIARTALAARGPRKGGVESWQACSVPLRAVSQGKPKSRPDLSSRVYLGWLCEIECSLYSNIRRPIDMHLSFYLRLTGSLLVGSSTVYARESNSSTQHGGYALKQPPLTTDWTDKVGTNPWQDYPRPQMQRPKWQNLNGVWRYQKANGTDDVDDPPFGETLPHAVLVPSCLESGLSGVLLCFA